MRVIFEHGTEVMSSRVLKQCHLFAANCLLWQWAINLLSWQQLHSAPWQAVCINHLMANMQLFSILFFSRPFGKTGNENISLCPTNWPTQHQYLSAHAGCWDWSRLQADFALCCPPDYGCFALSYVKITRPQRQNIRLRLEWLHRIISISFAVCTSPCRREGWCRGSKPPMDSSPCHRRSLSWPWASSRGAWCCWSVQGRLHGAMDKAGCEFIQTWTFAFNGKITLTVWMPGVYFKCMVRRTLLKL